MAIEKVALAGATGNLGPKILTSLLDAGFEVIVLSRADSTNTKNLPSHPNQTILNIDYTDTTSLTNALKGVNAVVSNLSGPALLLQKALIDASIETGVSRFIPSEFGSDLHQPEVKDLPFFANKAQIEKYLLEKVEKHPELSYTFLCNGPFLDWCIDQKLIMDVTSHSVTYYDGGDSPFSSTTTTTVGKAVAAVLRHEEETRNKTIYVHDAIVTQRKLVEMAKEIDGKEWKVEHGNTADAKKMGVEELSKPEPDFYFSIFNQLRRALFAREANPAFKRVDNEVLGLPLLDDAQLREVVKQLIAST